MEKKGLKQIIRDIYFHYFHEQIIFQIENRINIIKTLAENSECLFAGEGFIIYDGPSKWIKTEDESFVWQKYIKIITQSGSTEIVFAILDLKSFTNPSFCLWFPTYDFTFLNKSVYSTVENDFTYIITKDIIEKHGLDQYLVKPFDLE